MPSAAMNGNDLIETVREAVTKAHTTGACLSLSQISGLCKVNYGRLWRFMHPCRPSDILLLDEAQRLYETLVGTPLLPSEDEK